MESIYGSMFPSLSMSDNEPEGMPTEEELMSTALIHGNEHLTHEQPNEPTRSEYYKNEFANGMPDHLSRQEQRLEQQEPQFEEPQQQTTDADFWYVPENISPQQRLDLLNDKFTQVKEYMQSDIFANEIDGYKNQRINEIESELQDFRIAYKALQSNPKDFMMQYLPEVLAEYGVSPVMTQEEIGLSVRNNLQQMYGEDYQQRVDPAEMFIPGSYSSMVYQSQQQLYQKYLQQNQNNEEVLKNWGQMVANGEINSQAQTQSDGFNSMPPEQQAQSLVQEYEQNWRRQGYTEDEFAEFVQQAQSTSMDMQQVHKVVYFEDYLSEAYKQGIEQGRQSFYNQVKNSGNANPVQRFAPSNNQQTQQPSQEQVDVSRTIRILSQGGLPLY